MTKFIRDGIEVPGIPKLYKWPDGGWRPEPPEEEGVLTQADLGNHIDFEALQAQFTKGDWVRHPTFGVGVIPSGDRPVLHAQCGTAYVEFDNGPGCHIALSLLTKVEPEEEQCPSDCLLHTPGALREQLASRLMDARWDGRYQDYALQGADVALTFFREHFDSKREALSDCIAGWMEDVDAPDDLHERLRAILFDEDRQP